MLWNRKWDKPQPKPATWASVIAWLETKDPNESYIYESYRCLAAQYNWAMGRKYNLRKALSSNPFTYLRFDRKLERLGKHTPCKTFGMALRMARTGGYG